MDNLSYIIGLNNGEGGGASSWSDIDGKPFNTVGTGLTVTAGKTLTTDGTFVTETALTTALTPYVDTTALTTALTPYVDYASMETALTPYAESANLATVATSGNYADLSNKPSIPDAVSVSQTLQSGTAIADITIGDTTTTLYAPSGGGSVPFSSIGNGLTVTAGGALQEAVPVYSEDVVHYYGPGLYLDSGFTTENYSDFDIYFNIGYRQYLNLDKNANSSTMPYRFALELKNGTVYDGQWSAYPYNGTFGGSSWYVNNNTYEMYIEGGDSTGQYRLHVYVNGAFPLWVEEDGEYVCNVAAICLYQDADRSTQYESQNIETICDTYNLTYDSINGSWTETIYHKTPIDYLPVNLSPYSGFYINSNSELDVTKVLITTPTWARGKYSQAAVDPHEPSRTMYLLDNYFNNMYVGGNFDFEHPFHLEWHGEMNVVEDETVDNKRIFYIEDFGNLQNNSTHFITNRYSITSTNEENEYLMICGKLNIGNITTDKNDISIEGWESILESIEWDSSKSMWKLTFREGVYPRGSIWVYKYYNKQNINAFFIPVDDSTIKVNSLGNLSSVIPAVTTTAGTYTLQAVVDANGVPTYSWVAQV